MAFCSVRVRGGRQLGATPQALARHIVHGELHYQLPDDWHWRPVSPQPGTTRPPHRDMRNKARSVSGE